MILDLHSFGNNISNDVWIVNGKGVHGLSLKYEIFVAKLLNLSPFIVVCKDLLAFFTAQWVTTEEKKWCISDCCLYMWYKSVTKKKVMHLWLLSLYVVQISNYSIQVMEAPEAYWSWWLLKNGWLNRLTAAKLRYIWSLSGNITHNKQLSWLLNVDLKW